MCRELSLTARDLVRRIASDAGQSYSEIARRVNQDMAKGKNLLSAVHEIARENGLDPGRYTLDPEKIAEEIRTILRKDYAQTLMISAVLAQMVESRGRDSLSPPAFFTFMEFLADATAAPKRREKRIGNVEEATTKIIELTTTLVSVICDWSRTGIVGVAESCPEPLRGLARVILRKTRLYQAGMWTCISCGKIVSIRETRALLCKECDARLPGPTTLKRTPPKRERHRTGYGRTVPGDTID